MIKTCGSYPTPGSTASHRSADSLRSQIRDQLGRHFTSAWSAGTQVNAYAAFDYVIGARPPQRLARDHAGAGANGLAQTYPSCATINAASQRPMPRRSAGLYAPLKTSTNHIT